MALVERTTEKPVEKVLINPDMKDRFLQFARNGRWGTCVGCPRDSSGHVYPEFCVYTDRYDHQLGIDALSEAHKRYLRAAGENANS